MFDPTETNKRQDWRVKTERLLSMFLFSRLTVRTRLYLLLLIPILGLIYFSSTSAIENFGLKQESVALQHMMRAAVAGGSAIHEMQKERGLSAGFIGSRGGRFRSELQEQRAKTDAALKALFDQQATGSPKSMAAIEQRIHEMPMIRSSVSELRYDGKASFGAYTKTIDAIVQLTVDVAKSAPNQQALRSSVAYLEFVRGKEFAGRERATLNGALAANHFEPDVYRRFIQIVGAQTDHFDAFREYATPEQVSQLDRIDASAPATEVARIRAIVTSRSQIGGFGVDPSHWFATITQKIDQMKDVEDGMAKDLGLLGKTIGDQATSAFWMNIVVLIASVGFALLAGLVIIRSLPGELNGDR